MIPKKEWVRDTLRMLLLLGAAVAVCSVLSRVHDDNNPFAVLIFVLAVAIVALVTNGYVWGVLGLGHRGVLRQLHVHLPLLEL